MSESQADFAETDAEKNLPVKTDSTIVPVTIKQILNAKMVDNLGNTKIIDYVERKEVYIVGMIVSSTRNSYSTMYEIDDSTGIYLAQVVHPESIDNDGNTELEIEQFEIGQYVYVIGRLASTSQENQKEPIPVISAYSIRECKDINQIACHLLQSLYVHLLTVKNNKDKCILEPTQNQITNYFVYNDTKVKKISNRYDYDNDSGSEKVNSSPIRLNEIPIKETSQRKIDIVKRAILRFLSNTNCDNTISSQMIIKHFSSTFSIDDIQSSLDALSYNGEIVCTGLDEKYYII